MTCLAHLMRGGTSRSSSLHSRSSPQHVGTRLVCINQSGISHNHHHHHQRSSSASPRSCSSLQRSISSSPSRHEHRVGCLRSHSPPSFSGSPPLRRAHSHAQEGSCSHKARAKACSREPKCSGKLSRQFFHYTFVHTLVHLHKSQADQQRRNSLARFLFLCLNCTNIYIPPIIVSLTTATPQYFAFQICTHFMLHI